MAEQDTRRSAGDSGAASFHGKLFRTSRHRRALRRQASAATLILAAGLCAGAAEAQEGLFLYVPNFNDDTVSGLELAADGTASVVATVNSVGTTLLTVKVRADQAYVYAPARNTNRVYVIDTATNTVVSSVATAAQPSGVTFNTNGTRAYVSNGSGSVDVFNVDAATGALSAVTNIDTGGGSGLRQISVSPDGSRVYAVDQSLDQVVVIDTGTNTVLTNVTVGDQPLGIAVSPDGSRLYVTNFTDDTLSIIDAGTNSVTATIGLDFGGTLGRGPDSVAVSPDGRFVYVANRTTGNVSIVNAATDTTVAVTAAGPQANGVAVSPDGSFLYVSSQGASDRVNAFTIDPVTGLLTANGTTAVGDSPLALSICSGGSGLLGSGGTFVAKSTAALACAGGAANFTGGTLLIDGTNLQIGAPVNFGAGGGTVNTDGNNAALTGAITGTGNFSKTGTGTLSIVGNGSAYTGTANVTAGTLVVGVGGLGSLGGDVNVASGAALGGTGTIGGDVTLASGARHAPGNSIGTQTVSGNYVNSGILAIEASPSAADKVIVQGTVDISGASLEVTASPATFASWGPLSGPYTIIDKQSAGAVTGTFANVTSNLLFLTPAVGYTGGDGNDVTLALVRNDTSFASLADSANQVSTANGAESLGSGAVWSALALSGSAAGLQQNLDLLSGEVHASMSGALLEGGKHLRQALGARTRAGFGGAGAAAPIAVAYNGEGGPMPVPETYEGTVFWASGYGAWGGTDSDGNAAETDRRARGVLFGADAQIGEGAFEGWRLGLMVGAGQTDMDADARASSAESNDYHLGAYAGTQFGALGLRTGLSYSFHDIESARQVSGGGLTDHLTADYDARLFQAFGEAGYRVETVMAELEPFASLAYLTLDADGFSETGGAAALSVQSATTETVYSTLGLRADKPFTAEGKELTLGLMAGWQHAFGDANASSINAFAGGTGFAIDGAPIAEDNLVIEAGLSGAISADAGLSVAYQGQLSDEAEDHGLTARLTVRF